MDIFFVIHIILKAIDFQPQTTNKHFSVFISGQQKLIVNKKNTALSLIIYKFISSWKKSILQIDICVANA